MVYSFDIFDTAIVRIWANPQDLFWELGCLFRSKGFSSVSADEFMNVRIKSEQRARQHSPAGEVNLEDIYCVVGESLHLSKELTSMMMVEEMALELRSCRVVPLIRYQIIQARQVNGKVVYLSDMYLPHDMIKSLLEKQLLWEKDDELYVSNQIGCSKASGELFKLFLTQYQMSPSSLQHIGDNIHSDVRVPQRLGIDSQHFSQSCLNRYEKLICDNSDLPLKFRSLIAGNSRLTRLQCSPELNSQQQIIWETTSSVTAPILFGYVYWCLEEAQRRGIERLYFIARDGQILLKIAKIITRNWGYDIDCRYLYGSRQSWHSPAIIDITEVELDWIFDPTYFLSVNTLCQRVNLTPTEIKEYLIEAGFLAETWDENLEANRRDLLKVAFANSPIREVIIAKANEYRSRAIGYFKQEGLADPIPFGIVDIGWTGRLQISLNKILKAAGMYPEGGITGFYFGLSKQARTFGNDSLAAYFYDKDNNSDRERLIQRALIEVFVSADHGSTTGFELVGDRYQPTLKSLTNQKAIDWGVQTQQSAAETYTNLLTEVIGKEMCIPADFIKNAEGLLKLFTKKPLQTEAQIYGGIFITEDQTENIYYELAEHLTLNDYYKFVFLRKMKHSNLWLHGSVSRQNSWVGKLVITLYELYVKIRRSDI
jgi:FMN phosphatase YigB (HAD superfamily)